MSETLAHAREPGPAVRCALALFVTAATATAADRVIDFNRDVRPILSDKCFYCHGPDKGSRAVDLRLDVREDAIDFEAIVPHKPDESLLLDRINTDDEDSVMPPPDSNRSLTAEQKETLRLWIEQGAEYAKHWSFHPLPKKVAPPRSGGDWARDPVDRFVHAALEAKGLEPTREADRRVWLRRVTFDLTGLPPTLEEINAFLADESAGAHERVVDRLLATDAHAERLASEWLDVARYSDTNGYQRDDERLVWPYRDWVVGAFKKNQAYDEFVTWQLAGDLLPGATREQKLATVFCRLHSHKKEGGVAVEEFRVENVADRTHTFASAFLGLTMECSRCHDHKYDAITMRDYYSLSSFFANIDERGLISYFTDATPTPAMPLPSADQEAKLALLGAALERAESEYAEAVRRAEPRFAAWMKRGQPRDAVPRGLVAHYTFDRPEPHPPEQLLFKEHTGFVTANDKKPLDPNKVIAFASELDGAPPAISTNENKPAPAFDGDGVLLSGDDPIVVPHVLQTERHEPVSFSIRVKPADTPERAVIVRRSAGWDDAGSIGYALVQRGARLRANVVHFWPGNALAVETDDLLNPGEWAHLTVTYDGSRKASGLRIYVDGRRADTRVVQDSLTRTITGWRGGHNHLAIGSRYRDRGLKQGLVDDFRAYDRALTELEVRHDFTGGETQLDATRDQWRAYYVATADEAVAAARDRLREARRRYDELMDAIPAVSIMREQPEPRPAYLLERGAYDAHGEAVTADTLASLPPFAEEAPRNRLGLARWLFEPDHPLTARVAVNRYWQLIFGAGLVRTPEDFGSQGKPPTHPELLDWLSRDFVDSGWDVRRLLRRLVLSATYRQDSTVTAAKRDRDPENLLLARGPAKPLPAEMIRDNALAASGLLSTKVGGPPVKPYDLPLAYTPVNADSGEGLYRRSLYTFWKRTSPSPVMMTMNANRREVCLLKRDPVSSPLQALVLLNGSQFVEASRVFAETLLSDHPDDLAAQIGRAFETLLSRPPTESELAILRAAHGEQLTEFTNNPELATKFLAVGEAPASNEFPPAELAATTVVVNAIMNLDESTRCR